MKHSSATQDPRPPLVEFRPGMRRLIEDAIESLILLLDEIDGDPDGEDDGSAEPSLGWGGQGIGHPHVALPGYDDERELDLAEYGIADADGLLEQWGGIHNGYGVE